MRSFGLTLVFGALLAACSVDGPCCSDGDCLGSAPVCDSTTGVCGKCTSSLQCSSGYSCNTTSGACVVVGDGGTPCGPNGCPTGKACVNNACVTETCNPPCGPPATCGANNSCVCPANCGGNCAAGTTCNTTTCQCGTSTGSSGGIFGSSGGLSSGGLPTSCTLSTCSGCPAGKSCFCIDPFSSSGLDPCSSTNLACTIGGGIGAGGICQ